MEHGQSERIQDALEEAILEGRYANGERLDETRLAAAFGVSRTPVREALRLLAAAGLVEQRAHRGVFVRQPGPIELFEMFQVMAELEALAVRLACPRISIETLAELRQFNEACRDAAEAGAHDAYYPANESFHQLIYEESGNAFLAGQCRDLQKRLRPYRRVQLQARGRMRQSYHEHAAVIAALDAADAQGAGQILQDHVAVQGEKFQHLMSAWGRIAQPARKSRPA